MGYKKPFDGEYTKIQLMNVYHDLKSSYVDGFVQWELKKELYEVRFLLNHILENSSTFSGEEEWLAEQNKKQMWQELKR